jgi:hypothetical protein
LPFTHTAIQVGEAPNPHVRSRMPIDQHRQGSMRGEFFLRADSRSACAIHNTILMTHFLMTNFSSRNSALSPSSRAYKWKSPQGLEKKRAVSHV